MNSSLNQQEDASPSIDYWQVLKNRYGIILLTFILVFMTAAVLTWVIEKKYESSALVKVLPPDSNRESIGGVASAGASSQMTRSFFQNEFTIVRAPATLERVIDELGLIERWDKSKSDVLKQLQAMVRAKNERGTDFIEISVRNPDNELARDIAQSVADSYMNQRNEAESNRGEKILATLEGQIRDQQDAVAEKEGQLQLIARTTRIIIRPGNSSNQDVVGIELLQRTETALRSQKAKIESNISTLLRLPGDRLLVVAAGMDLPENTVKNLYPQYTQSKVNLDSLLSSGLGENHPKVLQLKTTTLKMKEELDQGVNSLREILGTQLEQIRAELTRIEQLTEEERSTSIDKSIARQKYDDAKRARDLASAILQELELKKRALEADLENLDQPATIYAKPEIGRRPVSPNIPLVFGLGAGVGLVLGLGLAFCLEYLDTSVKTLEDVERYLKVPVLAVIPQDIGLLHKQNTVSPDAEAYRILRTNIEFNRKNPEDNSITVVSGGAGEGKSTTLTNLAYICAQGGYTTLMIDGDLRRPRLHTFFDINNSVGLTNYLTTEMSLEDVILQTPVDNLFFMPSGIQPADAAGILNSRRMSELLQNVKQRFDLILVDSPPILGVSDASVLAAEVDLTMIVVQHRKLPRNMLQRVKLAVENVGGNVLGVVLNNVDVKSDSQYQYYTSYYTYYAPDSEDELSSAKRSVAGGAETSSDVKSDIY